MLNVPRVYGAGSRCVRFIAIPAKVPDMRVKPSWTLQTHTHPSGPRHQASKLSDSNQHHVEQKDYLACLAPMCDPEIMNIILTVDLGY